MKKIENNKMMESLNDEEIIRLYSDIMNELKKRKIVRTKNIIGDLGEKIAVDIYNKTPGEANLQIAPKGTRNVVALGRNDERYNIKTIRTPNRTTGVFYGLEPVNSNKHQDRKFEYAIIVILNDILQPIKILEISWDVFLKHKKWHSRTKAWTIYVNKKLESKCRIIFNSTDSKED